MDPMFQRPALIPIRTEARAIPLAAAEPEPRFRHGIAVPLILVLSLALWNLLALLFIGL